jgi:alginate O-acetyltransferase complex protein AlgJ
LHGIRQSDLEPAPPLTLSAIFSGNFQTKFEKWFGQNFGFRNHLVKTYNQILYSFFNESPTSGVGEGLILGKAKQIYGIHDVGSYIQLSPPTGRDQLEAIGIVFAELQTLLHKRGVTFIVLLTPNKATLYPEFLPNSLRHLSRYPENENYRGYRATLERHKVHFVDGVQILRAIKEQSAYPLFPRGGYHWNDLGAFHVLRELMAKMEELTGKTLIRLALNGIHVDYNGHGPDMDAAQPLNLLFPPFRFVCPRPLLTRVETPGCFKPRILFEGGSYNWVLLTLLQKFKIPSALSAIFYYKSYVNYEDPKPENRLIEKINWEADIFGKDMIIFEINPTRYTDRLEDLGQGFIQDAIAKLKKTGQKTKF